MHGRVKVRTTEEERERKKKEQVLKMRAYRAAMTRIQRKRSSGELDDELLGLTVQILQRNPDVSTLWNIRRECVLKKVAQLEKLTETAVETNQEEEENEKEEAREGGEGQAQGQGQGEGKGEGKGEGEGEGEEKDKEEEKVEKKEDKVKSKEEQLQAIYATELDLTEQCLMVNPKSYNGWHHRCWTLEQNPKADWQRELQLCNKYLKYDERNFHTWDYRRYVSAKAAVPAEQELDFCTEKIKVNFSNYSSWHHRSLLLPTLYPNEQKDRPMSEHKLKQELEMVLTAAFTDPNDSSAWFYQRWLLGNGAQLEQPAQVAAFRCEPRFALLALNKSCPDLSQLKVQLISERSTVQLVSWTALNEEKTQWECDQSFDIDPKINYNLDFAGQSQELSLLPSDNNLYCFVPPQVASSCSRELLIELESQLKSCLDLLEYEPDSKWTILTSALLMRTINAATYHERILDHLTKLQEVDALRQGYYKDLAQRWTMELALAKWPESEYFPQLFKMPTNMPKIPYFQYLMIADVVQLEVSENSPPT